MQVNFYNKSSALALLMSFVWLASAAQIRFRENKGQWEERVLYRTTIPGGDLYLEKDGLTYAFYDEGAVHDYYHDHADIQSYARHVVKVKFDGAQAVTPAAFDTSSEYYNYFLGNDPAHWASGVKAFNKILYRNLYENIDLEIIAQDQAVKYNFIVHPGGDPDDITLNYLGGDEVALNDGILTLSTTLNYIVEQRPYSFQQKGQEEKEVNSSFQLKGQVMRFKVGSYNKNLPLVIDPLVVFSTFSGSVADNFGFTATYDDQGNGYGGGTVYEQGYPVTTGAYQQDFKGPFPNGWSSGTDAGIMKLSPDGKQLLYATYIGGSQNDRPHSMVVNGNGELIILGTTSSNNFPTSSNAYSRSLSGGSDIFIARLSADGKKLLASTLVGGSDVDGLNGNGYFNSSPIAYNYGDQFRGEVITDNNNNVLIASCTESADFPVKNAFKSSYGGDQDGVVMKLTADLDMLLWSSYIGGGGADAAYGLYLSPNNDLYVCGGTQSNNFFVSSDAVNPVYKGATDGFVIKVNPNSGQLLASTFLGTPSYDQAYFVQLDGSGQVYVMGQTKGTWTVTSGVYTNSNGKQFITILDPALSSIKGSTVFGTGNSVPDLSPSAFLVDLCGRVYVSGWGGGTNNQYNHSNSRMNGMPLSDDAFQSTTDGSDFYLIIFSRLMKELVYATYFGGSKSNEHVDGGTSRFDRHGKVYQSVCAGCGGFSDFPTTDGAWSETNNGKRPNSPEGGCNNAVFKIDLNSSNYAPEFNDTVITVVANEKIDFPFVIKDRDQFDSVFFTYSGPMFNPDKFPAPYGKMESIFGIGMAAGRFTWQTSCAHVTNNDTLVVSIFMRDDGCPTPRTSVGTIKIVVEPPPPPDPPAIFCLKRIEASRLELNWGEFETGGYVSHYNLLKRYPDGHTETLMEIRNPEDLQFIDFAPDHRNIDYCYTIYGVNICGVSGDSTRWECSIPDEDSLPPSSYIYTVTVINNASLKLVWQKYADDDFYMYKILRRENNPLGEFQLIKTIRNVNDTVFLDSSVDVHERSYCYVVANVDQCFLESAANHHSCSIHLSGESIPFEHHLAWNKYEEWDGGVKEYLVMRKDPYHPDSNVITTEPLTLQRIDKNLDLDVGLYWYRIIGIEGDTGYSALSVSNEIELVQAPQLYVPNVFSPNSDGSNDLWNMVPVFVKDFEVKVYNRWGERVFYSTDRHDRWDGTYKGREPFDAVFVYIITFTGWDETIHYAKGTVTAIR